MFTKTKLIGISGCTNGGKTTLSKRLLIEFPNSYYMSQDDFYHDRSNKEKHYEYIASIDSFNFDTITAIDMNKFHKELNKLIKVNTYDYIFIDGILLYDDVKLHKMLHKHYFIDLEKEECHRRRQSRNYIFADTVNYFEHAWNEFSKYKKRCQTNFSNLLYLNGAELPDKIFGFVFEDLITLHQHHAHRSSEHLTHHNQIESCLIE